MPGRSVFPHLSASVAVLAVVAAGIAVSPPTAAKTNGGVTAPRLIAPPDDHALQFEYAQVRSHDVETSNYIRSATARTQFSVDGAGLAIAVLDSGLRVTHVDFAGKVPVVRNFTADDSSNPNVVTDGNGHGTNVAGVAAARGIHTGIAPGANVVPLKVLSNSGSGSFASVNSALDWVLANATTHNISVVNMSLGDGSNYAADTFAGDALKSKIQQLRQRKIPVVISAGNSFYGYYGAQGMGYPAIITESISVGAQYDANIGSVSYGSGAIAYSTAAGRICPFSQRLHTSTSETARTDIFAPGAALTSAGKANDTAESTMHGTSQAAPVVAGVILLGQQYAKRVTGQLPTVDQLERWLRTSTTRTVTIDGDDENDNVTNSGLQFQRVDVVDFLTAAQTELSGSPPPVSTPNTTAAYSLMSNTLTLTGDALANTLTISRSGSTIRVTPATGQTVNSTSGFTCTVSNTTTFRILVNGNAGNDRVTVQAVAAGTVQASLGDGNDALAITSSTVTSLIVNGGSGTDTLTTTSSAITSRSVSSVP